MKLGSVTFRSISSMSASLSINQNNRVGAVTSLPQAGPMTETCLSFDEGPNTETTLRAWQDSDGVKLETQMTEVAVEIVLTAEIRYRERASPAWAN
jgi:hypothetical protein